MNCSVLAPYQFHASEANGVAPAGAAGPNNVRADQAGDKPGLTDEVFDERFPAVGIQADGLDVHALDETARAAPCCLGDDDPATFQNFADDFGAKAALDCEKRHARWSETMY